MTKQQHIEKLENELKEAYEMINTLRDEADKGFETSPEYQRMKQDLRMYELSQDLAKTHIKNEIKSDRQTLIKMQKLLEDNRNLCAEHGIEYWVGLTEANRWGYPEVADLEKKIFDLETELAAKDVIIEHFKDLLGGRDPLAPKETVMGRRPVPEEQKKRIRSYRRKGYTIKEISEMEGVSLGAVSNICKGIKKKANG